MSSVALLGQAEEVVGLDASTEMIRRARRAFGVRYLASSAETLPFAPCTFDLVVACGSIDWVDRTKFMPEAARLLEGAGWLVPLDFGDTARSPSVPGLEDWHRETFLARFPRPPSRDPIIGNEEAATHGFCEPAIRHFAFPCPFTAGRYADFLLTESSVIAAVEFGCQKPADVRDWLVSQLSPMFGGQSHDIDFGGYIQLLRRLGVER
jgi:SAM-dependent methyltransferase